MCQARRNISWLASLCSVPCSVRARSIISAKPPWFAASLADDRQRVSPPGSSAHTKWLAPSPKPGCSQQSLAFEGSLWHPVRTTARNPPSRKLKALNELACIRNSDMGISLISDRRLQAEKALPERVCIATTAMRNRRANAPCT
ncbi:hypothetical protein HDV63DRAFT_49215 [Trichoderma sp. SZMC 28014]